MGDDENDDRWDLARRRGRERWCAFPFFFFVVNMTAVALGSQECCFKECWTNTGWSRCCRLPGLCGHVHPTNYSSELSLLEETLIQSQQGTQLLKTTRIRPSTSVLVIMILFSREIGHQLMLICQQLLYRDSLEFPSERKEAIKRPPRGATQPTNQVSCEPCARTSAG